MNAIEAEALAGAGLTPAIDRLRLSIELAPSFGGGVRLSPEFAQSLIALMERCRDTLESQSDEIAAARDRLHGAIMNLQIDPPNLLGETVGRAYKLGHRDARHAAAELAIAPRSQS